MTNLKKIAKTKTLLYKLAGNLTERSQIVVVQYVLICCDAVSFVFTV